MTEKHTAVMATIRDIMNQAKSIFNTEAELLTKEDITAELHEFNEYLTKKIFALLDKIIDKKLV